MKKTKWFHFLLLFTLSTLANRAELQVLSRDSLADMDSLKIHVLKTVRGDRLFGKLLIMDSSKVVFQMGGNELVFHPTEIAGIEMNDSKPLAKKENVMPALGSPFQERPNIILFTPTAFMLRKGEFEYRNTLVLFNTLDYGVTDYFTLGAGLAPYLIFGGILSVRLKLGFELTEFLRFSAGSQLGLIQEYGFFSNPGFELFALGNGTLTLGKRGTFISISLSKAYSDDNTWFFSWSSSVKLTEKINIRAEFLNLEAETKVLFLGPSFNWRSNKLDTSIGFQMEPSPQIVPGVAYSWRFAKKGKS